MMNCLICRQAEIVDGLTSVSFERDEMKLLVNNVPARVCPSCGDAIVDEDVAVRLLEGAEQRVRAGIMEDTVEYMEIN
jgi:YgiT-type zinc finger domain-containing protein